MRWLLCLAAVGVLLASYQCEEYRTVCYYTNWAQYRSGKGHYLPENVDPFMCTHLIYAFAKPVGLNIAAFEWNDESTQWMEGMYAKTIKLKERNPALKILLAVGGYNMGSQPFVPIVDSPASRSTFAQNAVKFLRLHEFDGLDMDWEYPGSRGSPPSDKEKLVLLMQELRRVFDIDAQSTGKPRLLLTAALPAGKDNIDSGFDVPNLTRFMDFVSIMTYDLHGSWEPRTGINSPLFAHSSDTGNDAHLNLHWVAQYYISLGIPKEKTNIGIALYGRSFNLDDPSRHDVGSPASQPGDAGLFTMEKGFLAYYEVCDHLNAGAQVVDVTSQRNRYLYRGSTWVGYDDIPSVVEKACYVKENRFGGVMFWALDLDDFTGQTCKQGTYPLITAVKNELKDPSLARCAKHPDSLVTPPPLTAPTSPGPATPSIIHSDRFDCSNKVDDFYPDPLYCDSFFICANRVTFHAKCGTGLLFNPERKHCEFDYLTTCWTATAAPGITANPTAGTTTARTTTTTTTTTGAAGPTTSSNLCLGQDNGAVVPHPKDCHKFFMCSGGAAVELSCQGSMVFNPTKGQCDFSSCSILA